MQKAILYKEWIKTRWVVLSGLLVLPGVTVYLLIRMLKVIDLQGAGHIWEVVITRNAIFIDTLRYLPLIFGVVLGLMQFIAEMQQKRLKLTLHLPVSQMRLVNTMLLYGILALGVCFAGCYGAMLCVMPIVLPVELWGHIMLTAVPWFLAGISGYLITGFIVLEPKWKRRVVYLIFAIPLLWIYFLSPTPGAYNGFLPLLTVFTFSQILYSTTSVARFKAGAQD